MQQTESNYKITKIQDCLLHTSFLQSYVGGRDVTVMQHVKAGDGIEIVYVMLALLEMARNVKVRIFIIIYLNFIGFSRFFSENIR